MPTRCSSGMSLDECLASVAECGAPVVSICGGEPLIYPQIGELVEKILAQGKHIYLCTNGLKLEKRLPELRPDGRLFINVHLDGMEATHDRLVERQGTFAAAVQGIQAAHAGRLHGLHQYHPLQATPTSTRSPCCSSI